MASLTTSKSSRAPLPIIKKAILNFIRGLVSNRVFRAVEIILSPCCSFTVTGTAVCDLDNPGNYILTFTLSRPLYLDGIGQACLDDPGPTGIPYVDGTTTITFNNYVGSAGISAVTLRMLLPVTYETVVIGISFMVIDQMTPVVVDFPSCVPSDINLKENIEKIGVSANGLNIYKFNYKGRPSVFQGVIAQELIGTPYEDAVIPGKSLMVDYAKIDVDFKRLN